MKVIIFVYLFSIGFCYYYMFGLFNRVSDLVKDDDLYYDLIHNFNTPEDIINKLKQPSTAAKEIFLFCLIPIGHILMGIACCIAYNLGEEYLIMAIQNGPRR